MNSAARQWLEDSLLRNGQLRLTTPEAIHLVKSQPAAFQIAILRACTEWLPLLRRSWSDRKVYELGSQLYAVTAALYNPKLPFQEADLCALLRSSQHSCGHGCDVSPPLELAMKYMAEHDVSQQLLSAIADYRDGLKGIGSIQAQNIKRKTAILMLLDRSEALGRRASNAWSQRFTADLETMPADQRRAWQAWVMSFTLNERVELPNTFRKQAQRFLGTAGTDQVLTRLEQWWPAPGKVCKLETGCSHLLKHMVWLLQTIDEGSPHTPPCRQLACQLADVQWKPLPPAAKVVCAAASYLATLPPSFAWDALQKLSTMAPSREAWLRDLVERYRSSAP